MVVVVGAGNSAVQITAKLAEPARLTWWSGTPIRKVVVR